MGLIFVVGVVAVEQGEDGQGVCPQVEARSGSVTVVLAGELTTALVRCRQTAIS